jgi:hypothetical protein
LILHLHIGRKDTGFTVQPDPAWPQMWRIHAPDGRVSDMVNLTRAKDAAVAWARPRGLGGDDKAYWHPRETAAGTVSMRPERPDAGVATPPAEGVQEPPGSAFSEAAE